VQLSPDDRRYVLEKFFKNAQIYRRDSNGNITANLANNFRYSRSLLGMALWGTMALASWAADRAVNQARKNYRPPVTGEAVDLAIVMLIDDHIQIAKDQLGIMDHQIIGDPLIINGPIFWRDAAVPLDHLCAREADDGYMRFSAQRVSIVLLTDKRMGVYVATLDTLGGHAVSQSAETYLYHHVTGITARDVQVQLDMGKENRAIMVRTFRISVMGGESVEVTLSSPAIQDQFGAHIPSSDGHDKTIAAIRQMWLSKT
jgi:hypothetical protein